jgi:hypothetical protein
MGVARLKSERYLGYVSGRYMLWVSPTLFGAPGWNRSALMFQFQMARLFSMPPNGMGWFGRVFVGAMRNVQPAL